MKRNPKLVSVIIPTYNSAWSLEETLKSIRAQDYPHIECIVVDNHSSDDTLKIAKKYADIVLTQGPERTAQKNYGISKSSGKYGLLIDGDMMADPDLISSCMSIITQEKNAGGICIPLEDIGPSYWTKVIAYERSLYKNTNMQAARFLDLDLALEVGGFDDIIFYEEFILPQKIEKLGYNCQLLTESKLYHNYADFTFFLNLKKKFYYGKSLHIYKQQMQELGIENSSDKQTSILHRFYILLSQRSAYISPLLLVSVIFLKICEFGAGGFGLTFQKINTFLSKSS